MEPRTHLLFFDGSLRTLQDGTNVAELYRYTKDQSGNTAWYESGLGVRSKVSAVLGGIFGYGLMDSVEHGYDQLRASWVKGDKVVLVGFSRGAFTARVLSGVIASQGISPYLEGRDAVNRYWLKRCKVRGSQEAKVNILLAFDTVGENGVPKIAIFASLFNKKFRLPDTNVRDNVDAAYHAMALDEYGPDFTPTLWDKTDNAAQIIEQRWFPGYHGDMGGGWGNEDQMSDHVLMWAINRLKDSGVSISSEGEAEVRGRIDTLPMDHSIIHDRYSTFLGGFYKFLRFFRKSYREPLTDKPGEVLDPLYKDLVGYKTKAKMPKNSEGSII